jgi:hypothetical protein
MVVLKRVRLGPHHHPSLTKHSISRAGGKQDFPPFTELVIAAAEPAEAGCYLFHVTAAGHAADTWHQSVDEALGQAEYELGVRPEEWIVPDRPETF